MCVVSQQSWFGLFFFFFFFQFNSPRAIPNVSLTLQATNMLIKALNDVYNGRLLEECRGISEAAASKIRSMLQWSIPPSPPFFRYCYLLLLLKIVFLIMCVSWFTFVSGLRNTEWSLWLYDTIHPYTTTLNTLPTKSLTPRCLPSTAHFDTIQDPTPMLMNLQYEIKLVAREKMNGIKQHKPSMKMAKNIECVIVETGSWKGNTTRWETAGLSQKQNVPPPPRLYIQRARKPKVQ